MKITCILQVPYRHLPDDFEKRFESVVTTPYHGLVETEKVGEAYRDTLAEFMHAARAGFDGLAITEHGQSSYDMAPNPNLVEAALAYATEAEGIETAIYPVGRSLGKSREPLRVAEEYAMLDAISNGRRRRRLPGRARLRREHQQRHPADRDPAPVRRESRARPQGVDGRQAVRLERQVQPARFGEPVATPAATAAPAGRHHRASATRAPWSSACGADSDSTTSAGSASG